MIAAQELRNAYARHKRWVPMIFFGLGFVFDALMLTRIDEFRTLVQQAVYVALSGLLIGVELASETRAIHTTSSVPPIFNKIWKYREAFLHFLLGTLLNSYTIFYFKSASTFTSFIFIAILIAILSLNEFKRFGKSQTRVHVAFWSLCLVSYFVSLAPILLGYIGSVPFLCGILASCLVFWVFFKILSRRLASHPQRVKTHVLVPFAVIQVLFVILYFTHAIPPVPLSVKYMGIFHDISKKNGQYTLSYFRPGWKFWQHGDQTFLARPGDKIYCFAQVYSPARFKDKLQVRWLYWSDKNGWLPSDAIAMPIEGGREEGFRGITQKNNFQPGRWRVQIETLDDRVVGQINLQVEADSSTEARLAHTLMQ
jgi:hypothetical protein